MTPSEDRVWLLVPTDFTNVGDSTHSRYEKTSRASLFVIEDAERILQAFTTEKELP